MRIRTNTDANWKFNAYIGMMELNWNRLRNLLAIFIQSLASKNRPIILQKPLLCNAP